MESENEFGIIEAAAELIRERSPLDPRVFASASWRVIGLDLEYPAQQVLRLRPAGDDATDVEVFSYGNLIASEQLRRYRTAARLAELVEGVHRRAQQQREPSPRRDGRGLGWR